MPRLLGLAIGVERYDEPGRNPVMGAADQARSVHKWLGAAGAEPRNAVLRVSPPASDETDADRAGVVSGFRALSNALRAGSPADGDTVVVYLSGHGYGLAGDEGGELTIEGGEDVFLTADWSSADPDSNGIRLAQVARTLQHAAGPGDHFWFVDACRNPAPTGKGVAIKLQAAGRPTPKLHRLFAAAPGTPAPVAGPFTETVLKGLNLDPPIRLRHRLGG